MNDKNIDKTGEPENKASEIVVNDYGATADSTVVVDEETRTVLLTDKETIVIEKEPMIDSVPKNRPRKIYAGMWGQAEIATVGIALLAILTVILIRVTVVFSTVGRWIWIISIARYKSRYVSMVWWWRPPTIRPLHWALARC